MTGGRLARPSAQLAFLLRIRFDARQSLVGRGANESRDRPCLVSRIDTAEEVDTRNDLSGMMELPCHRRLALAAGHAGAARAGPAEPLR